MKKWTSITEALPPIGQPLIVTVEISTGGYGVSMPVYYEKKVTGKWGWRHEDRYITKVTAWMPMLEVPEPYTEE